MTLPYMVIDARKLDEIFTENLLFSDKNSEEYPEFCRIMFTNNKRNAQTSFIGQISDVFKSYD